jgi:DNA-binding NarL/FixJ family response regulator
MQNIQFDQKVFSRLTDREIEIARASLEGLTPSEISEKFNIKPSTLSSFRCKIIDKTGCRTFIEAIGRLIKGGIL